VIVSGEDVFLLMVMECVLCVNLHTYRKKEDKVTEGAGQESEERGTEECKWYGVTTISRLLKIVGLFCRI